MGKEKVYGVWAVRSGASIFGHAEAWCKEDGKPLEFDTRKAAEAYAGEMNSRTTANVHYYAQEKEPEPGAVRKTSAQPDLDARAHEEVTPRNDAAEKQNEIPGRQAMPEADPLVVIVCPYAGFTVAEPPGFRNHPGNHFVDGYFLFIHGRCLLWYSQGNPCCPGNGRSAVRFQL